MPVIVVARWDPCMVVPMTVAEPPAVQHSKAGE